MSLRLFLGFLFFLLFSACASSPVAPRTDDADEEIGTLVETGPVLEQESIGTEVFSVDETEANEPARGASETVRKKCLVLGPGMAKSLSFVGAIEALEAQLNDLYCIVGVEMGAVVGALFADKRQLNAVKWQLFKIKKEVYWETGLLPFANKRSSGKKLHQLLEEFFGTKRPMDLRIKFVALFADEKNTAVIRDDWPLADVLSAGVAIPGSFAPWRGPDGKSYHAAAHLSALPVEIAQGMGATEIIVLDALDDVFAAEAPGELASIHKYFFNVRKLSRLQSDGQPNLVQLRLPNVSFLDFGRQEEIFLEGRTQTQSLEIAKQ